MPKKIQSVNIQKTTVKLLKSCVPGGEGQILELETSQAEHLINMGYAEISSGKLRQENQDTAKE